MTANPLEKIISSVEETKQLVLETSYLILESLKIMKDYVIYSTIKRESSIGELTTQAELAESKKEYNRAIWIYDAIRDEYNMHQCYKDARRITKKIKNLEKEIKTLQS